MPFTPFHFGPGFCVALFLKKHIDFPAFLLANVVIDIEPLIVILFGLNYPFHGYCHTFLIGSLLGVLWALIAYLGKGIFQKLMKLLKLPYNTNFGKMVISAILGIWFHVLLDAPLYRDIKPFYPIKINPLYGFVSESTMYSLCRISSIPALLVYVYVVRRYNINTRPIA